MIEQGLLTTLECVERIDGEFVERATPGDPHATCISLSR